MGGTGVVDRFLAIFSQYIDSGFGLLSGEVAFIATPISYSKALPDLASKPAVLALALVICCSRDGSRRWGSMLPRPCLRRWPICSAM